MSPSSAGSSSQPATRASRIAAAAVVILWSCLLFGLLGRVAWPFDLFANFRVQYFVLFLALIVVLALTDRKRLAVAALLGAGVAAVPLFGYMTLPSRSAAASPGTFRLVTFNVWYRNRNLTAVARYLESTRADAIVVQELTSARAAELHALLPSYPQFVTFDSSSIGAVIYSKWPLVRSGPVKLSAGVNGSLATLNWQGKNVNLLGVHLHWPIGSWSSRLRDEELRSIATFAAGFPEPLLVAGDMNLTAWSPYFRELLESSGLTDGAAGHGLMPSWPSQFRLAGIRIDQCLMTPHWRSVSVNPGPHLGSDHRPLVADLQLAARPEVSPSEARGE